MNDIEQEKAYWDNAAKDPQVAVKYIADVDLQECLDAIIPEVKGPSILEIGCGIGRLTEAIATNEMTRDCQLHGIDTSESMLALCPRSSVKYKLCDGRKIPYPDESFDSIYSMLVFQHIDDAAMLGYIKEAYRVLKDGGVLRFQFVGGSHHSLIDHNHNLDEVLNWLKSTGFDYTKVEMGLIHPQWVWMSAVKV